MSTKVFVTGATGYIGGDAFHVFNQVHPEWEYTALVRNSDRGAVLAKTYPKVRLVYGDLDSSDLIEAEASRADIIAHFADADHQGAVQAILAGMKKRTETPNFLIQTSGTGVLTYPDIQEKTYGELRERVWDDVKDIEAIIHEIPSTAPHAIVDKAILQSNLKTAIVAPPCIYGTGRGANPTSIQFPKLAAATLELRRGFYLGEGKAVWSEVHVQDLSQVYLRLAEAAAAGGGAATWGSHAYYFAENGHELEWGEAARLLAKAAKKLGLLKTDEVDSLTTAQVVEVLPFGPVVWGANSRSRATRAREVLGWKPEQKARAFDLLEEVLQVEARKLQK